jgi:hypothetical protein
MIPSKKTARLAGLAFLFMVITGLFAEIFFRQKVFVLSDIAATVSNISSNTFLYRTGIVSDILMSLGYLFTALVLFKLLASVNKNLAAVMVLLAAAGSALLMFNILNECAPLYILTGNDYLNVLGLNSRQAIAMLYYSLYEHGYMIGQIFFALWVLPLAVLIYKSGFIPKVLGVLFVIETIFGFLSVFVHFLVPNQSIETILLLPGTVAEFAFMFWLLIRGIRKPKMTEIVRGTL